MCVPILLVAERERERERDVGRELERERDLAGPSALRKTG
jgi:hypothetical protein